MCGFCEAVALSCVNGAAALSSGAPMTVASMSAWSNSRRKLSLFAATDHAHASDVPSVVMYPMLISAFWLPRRMPRPLRCSITSGVFCVSRCQISVSRSCTLRPVAILADDPISTLISPARALSVSFFIVARSAASWMNATSSGDMPPATSRFFIASYRLNPDAELPPGTPTSEKISCRAPGLGWSG